MKGLRSKWFNLGVELGLIDNLEIIRRQHNSDEEACLKAVIEAFLRGEGHYQPSWRIVIHVLYRVGETRIAQDIINYAEPVEGERVCELLRAWHHTLCWWVHTVYVYRMYMHNMIACVHFFVHCL